MLNRFEKLDKETFSLLIFLFFAWGFSYIRTLNKTTIKMKSHIGLPSSPHGLRISNLMLAYDCLIFGKASRIGGRKILKILDDFSMASSQKNQLS